MGLNKLLLVTMVASVLVSYASAQNTVHTPPSAEELAKLERHSIALGRGDAALKVNNLSEAISAYREAAAMGEKFRGFCRTGYYRLARVFELAGRSDDALAAFKKCFKWDQQKGDLVSAGSQTILVSMEYAILLAKCNRLEEAKAVYYYGLRCGFNIYPEKDFEPIPFRVVFDDDPEMDVWDFTKENLITAALMAKMPWMQNELPQSLEEVLKRDSSLVFAQIMKAQRADDIERDGLYSYVEGQAKTERERQWIRDFRDGKNLAPVGAELRKNSQALNQAKKDLEKIHKKIAS